MTTATKHATGAAKPATDPATKTAALQIASSRGVRAASEETGVPQSTIRGWRARERKRAEIVPAAGVVHGAYSERAIAARAKVVHQQLLAAAPWLAEDRFMPAVSLYLRSAARSSLLDEYIERIAAEKGIERVPARTIEQAISASNRAFKQAEALGITPAGFNKLKLLAAGAAGAEDSIAKLQAQGRAIREARDVEVGQ
jgi:hypothetical protein